jgi:hypothetical protein
LSTNFNAKRLFITMSLFLAILMSPKADHNQNVPLRILLTLYELISI